MKRTLLSLGALSAVAMAMTRHGAAPKSPLIVHEWGTITTRHLPNGTPQGRLNHTDSSEILPSFVHRYEPPATVNNPEKSLLKEPIIPGRPDVTMRLETPVIYFHRPNGSPAPAPFDVSVRFRGGVLNEFYPNAEPSAVMDAEHVNRTIAHGSYPGAWGGDVLDSYVVGGLIWRGVAVADSATLTPTSSHVWLAPRHVPSSDVVVNGERERYLFYRGVAHLDALLQTELLPGELLVRAPKDLAWMHSPTMTITRSWLVESRPDGSAAFREQPPITIEKNAPGHEVGRIARFTSRDFAENNLAELRTSMKRALIDAGLYESEADAMLETWSASYFRMPGLRLLYLVPNEWLGYFLPLRVSAPHELTRVLVGRIDLLTTGAVPSPTK